MTQLISHKIRVLQSELLRINHGSQFRAVNGPVSGSCGLIESPSAQSVGVRAGDRQVTGA